MPILPSLPSLCGFSANCRTPPDLPRNSLTTPLHLCHSLRTVFVTFDMLRLQIRKSHSSDYVQA